MAQYTEINHYRGMNYGGMPHDQILYKLEETDPVLVGDVRGKPYEEVENQIDDYRRGVLIDWNSDPITLESDHARRDPSLSTSQINLRYNGGRGHSDDIYPRHPEMFLGFTGNDPRGAQNDPRFEQFRHHVYARAPNLTVRMGKNDDQSIPERPRTGAQRQKDRTDLQKLWRKRAKIFSTGRVDNHMHNMNINDPYYVLRQRSGALNNGAEGIDDIYYLAHDENGIVRLAPVGYNDAPWEGAVIDGKLSLAYYGGERSGRGQHDKGQAKHQQSADQTVAEQHSQKAANRKHLAATMESAINYATGGKQGTKDGMQGSSEGSHQRGGANMKYDVAKAVAQAKPDSEMKNGYTAWSPHGAHLFQAGDFVGSKSEGKMTHDNSTYLQKNAMMIAASLKPGNASELRKIKDKIIKNDTGGGTSQMAEYGKGLTAATSKELADARNKSIKDMIHSQAGQLTLANYKGAAPVMPLPGPETQSFDSFVEKSREGADPYHQMAPKWRSDTTGYDSRKPTANFGMDIDPGASIGAHGSSKGFGGRRSSMVHSRGMTNRDMTDSLVG
jgi:hypothetical protein